MLQYYIYNVLHNDLCSKINKNYIIKKVIKKFL